MRVSTQIISNTTGIHTDWLKTEERVVRFYETGKMKTILAKNHIW